MANPIVLRHNTRIGESDAESDEIFLEECFVDGGQLEDLLDCTNHRSIVLGRTGSGKTALLQQVSKRVDNCITIEPQALSLNYVANSKILQLFEAAGVHLDVFYQLLWRHIFTVELLKKKYNIINVHEQNKFQATLTNLFGTNTIKAAALNYLKEWGDQFWTETHYRTKEFTSKLETELVTSGDFPIDIQSVDGKDIKKLTDESRAALNSAGQRIVNNVQIKQLGDVVGLLAEDIFVDRLKPYYIVIDKLDENWVDDRIRFKLIESLFDAIKSFRKVRNLKIIVALRTDIHFRVLKNITNLGFQTEKYSGTILRLRWTRAGLIELLDKRVNFQFRRQYSREGVTLQSLLPSNEISKRSAIDYILDRTFLRPREAIIFMNECIAQAEGGSKITTQIIRSVEVRYSNDRLRSLEEEWRREYPALRAYLRILERRPSSFSMDSITEQELDKFCEEFLSDPKLEADTLQSTFENYYLAHKISKSQCLRELFRILYQVGVVGVKEDPKLGRQWSIIDTPELSPGQPIENATLFIQQTFWAALSVQSSVVDWQLDGRK